MHKLPPPLLSSASHTPILQDRPNPSARLIRGTEAVRCLFLSLLALLTGFFAARKLLFLLPAEETAAILSAHLAQGAPPAIQFLRLCLFRLPVLLLLGAAGFTRFSGSLTTALLTLRGLSEGAALWVLLSLRTAETVFPPLAEPEGLRILAAYAVWTAMDLAARTGAAAEARRLARGAPWPEGIGDAVHPALRARLWRYAARFLAALCLSVGGCAVYWLILSL